MTDTKEHISLEFNAQWYYIQHVWAFIQSMLGEVLDKKKAEMIALSVSELVENSVKYSKHSISELNVVRIMLEIFKDRNLISLEVQNFSEPEHIKELEKELASLTSMDPKELFKTKLLNAAKRDDDLSQLGLIRIIYEAKGRVEMASEGNKVAMRVEFDIKDNKTI